MLTEHCKRSTGTERAWFRTREEAEACAADLTNLAYHGDIPALDLLVSEPDYTPLHDPMVAYSCFLGHTTSVPNVIVQLHPRESRSLRSWNEHTNRECRH
jgi:hypothetical protein